MEYEVRYRQPSAYLNISMKNFKTIGEAQLYAARCNTDRKEFFDLVDSQWKMSPEEYEKEYTRLSDSATNDFVHSGGTFYATKVEAYNKLMMEVGEEL